MLELVTTNQFKKDLKRIQKRGYNLQKLHNILNTLRSNQTLSPKYRDHALTGNYIGFRECHIEPDWLLIYKYYDDILVLSLSRLGSHSELF